MRYYAGTFALVRFGPGRELLCTVPRRNLAGSQWLELEAELGIRAAPAAT